MQGASTLPEFRFESPGFIADVWATRARRHVAWQKDIFLWCAWYQMRNQLSNCGQHFAVPYHLQWWLYSC